MLALVGLAGFEKRSVTKLSGGQRKRLSIAVEYIADPSMFFLDEPDSGLDGIMSRSLMENLRTIANENKIVMVISHGPEVLPGSDDSDCSTLPFSSAPVFPKE